MDQVDIATNFYTDIYVAFDVNKWYLHICYLYSQQPYNSTCD